MMTIPRKYIIDEANKKVAVQLDMETFKRLENLLMDYGLEQIMKEEQNDDVLEGDQARSYYQNLIDPK